jgi:hypothetical protein
MVSDNGTDGISHTIHLADENSDGELSNFRKFNNVLDVMNTPDGSVKFIHEGKQETVEYGRIVRSTVRGVEDAFRYRCSDCLVSDTDIISQCDRGDSIQIFCSVCEKETDHVKRDVDEI